MEIENGYIDNVRLSNFNASEYSNIVTQPGMITTNNFNSENVKFSIEELDDKTVIKAELLGYELKNLNIKYKQGKIMLSGSRKALDRDVILKKEFWIVREKHNIDDINDINDIWATFQDGILTIEIPLKEEFKAKTIHVFSNRESASFQKTLNSLIGKTTRNKSTVRATEDNVYSSVSNESNCSESLVKADGIEMKVKNNIK